MPSHSSRGLSFRYNAHAHGFSAQIRRPFCHDVPVQAGTSLPAMGGHGSARGDHFKLNELISFQAAYSHVSGSAMEDGAHTTLVTAVVERMNILDVVTADRVVAHLAIHHEPEGKSRTVFVGSKFENLRIGSYEVKVVFDEELLCGRYLRKDLETFADFRASVQKDKAFGDMVARRHCWTPEHHQYLDKGLALCSLVKSVQTECPCVEVKGGNVLVVPQFGKVFLGELLLKPHEHSLTMMRIELGSPVAGIVTAAEGSGNGQPYPS